MHRISNQGTRESVVINRNQILTPGVRDYLREYRVEVICPQGEAAGERAPPVPAGYRTLFGATLNEKSEHMTHLKGNVLVSKDHPHVVSRGWTGALEAEILLTQQAAAREGYGTLVGELEEVLGFVRRYIRFDVLDEPVGAIGLCGYTPKQLREYSHYLKKRLGQPHFLAYYTDGPALLVVNKLRAVVRQTELVAYAVFHNADESVTRDDTILGPNRLSSLMWIFMTKLKVGRRERKQIEHGGAADGGAGRLPDHQAGGQRTACLPAPGRCGDSVRHGLPAQPDERPVPAGAVRLRRAGDVGGAQEEPEERDDSGP